MEVTLREAKKMLRALVKQGKGAILLGSPGIAKSAVVRLLAKEEEGWGITVHEAPSLDPTEARGLMFLDKDLNQSRFSKAPIFPRDVNPDYPHLLVFEELTSALPALQVALHSVFHPTDKRIGEYPLPKNVVPIGIGNYANDGAGARALLNALKDRVMVMNIYLPYKDWRADYAIPKRVHPLVLGLLEYDQKHFNTFGLRKGANSKDFVTPRTHTEISDWIYACEADNLGDDLLFAGIANYGGEGIAAEYTAFKKYYDLLPNLDKILDGENFLPKDNNKAQGVMYAVCSALVSRIGYKDGKPQPKLEQKHVRRLMEYAIWLKHNGGKHIAGAEWGELIWMDIMAKYQKADGETDTLKIMKVIDDKSLIDRFYEEFKMYFKK